MRKGTVILKEMFLNHLYGGMEEPEIKIIDVFICKLRNKLKQKAEGVDYIETVWGRGYMLSESSLIEEESNNEVKLIQDNVKQDDYSDRAKFGE
jgi:two-component system cell cycle response regulator CtrA